jgi:hypothetical protein
MFSAGMPAEFPLALKPSLGRPDMLSKTCAPQDTTARIASEASRHR